jgi:hypothetical protein
METTDNGSGVNAAVGARSRNTNKEKDIIYYIKNKNAVKIEPSFEPTLGFIYTEIEHLNSLEEQVEFLESGVKIGIFDAKPSISLLNCSSCNSLYFATKFVCIFCKSHNVTRGEMIAHDSCGNIDFDYKYMSPNGNLVCEKCNNQLKTIGIDYSRLGHFYKCLDCRATLPNIDQIYVCLRCSKSSLSHELGNMVLSTYTINTQKLTDNLYTDNFLFSVVQELDRLGIKSSLSETVVGTSKMSHTFSLVVYDETHVPFVAVDVIESSSSSSSSSYSKVHNDIQADYDMLLLAFIGKFSDVQVPYKVLLSIPPLKEKHRDLANINKVILVQSDNKHDAILQLSQTIAEIYNRGLVK